MSAATALSMKRRILLVDDLELNRVLTEAVLRSATYEVDSVTNGAAAIAALEHNTYDLVLMDLEMPGLDGHETAAAIRRREAETAAVKTVPMATISARSGSHARLRSAEIGMAAHIARPIAPHELLRQIESVFCQPKAAEPDPWQRECYEEWAARLGVERTDGFLLSLRDQFCAVVEQLDQRGGTEELHRLAHDVASTGGMLGFPEVTRCCRALLEASDVDAEGKARSRLRDVLERAVTRLDQHFSVRERVAEAA